MEASQPAPNPIADTIREKISSGLADAVAQGIEALYTAASYLHWVKMSKYPWWWGPIKGLKDVLVMLQVTADVYAKARYIPPPTKAIAAANLSAAQLWVREQLARQASQTGGPAVPFRIGGD